MITTMFFIFALHLTACDRMTTEPQTRVPEKNEFLIQSSTEQNQTAMKKNWDLYYMHVTDTTFALMPEKRALKANATFSELMEALLKGPQSDLEALIPIQTKLKGVEVKNNIAYLDFTKDLIMGNYGSETEMLTIQSIVKTMKQFEEVDAVQILVEGSILDTLGGHVDISEPIR